MAYRRRVSCPRLDEVRPYWADDPGSLLDAYVSAATLDDWQLAVATILSLGWPSDYFEDGEPIPMPPDVRQIFFRRSDVGSTWQIRPAEQLRINCHFFASDEIEFDFDPREIRTQEHLDFVCSFISVVGRALRKSFAVGIEGHPPDRVAAMMAYDPTRDEVVALRGWWTSP
jgi:hypothetical protein